MSQPWQPNGPHHQQQTGPQQWAPPPPPQVPPQWGPPPQQQWPVIRPGMPPYPVPPARQGASIGVVFGGIALGCALVGLVVLPIVLGPAAVICGIVGLACSGGDSRAKGMAGVGLGLGLLDTIIVMSAISALL